MARPKKQIKVSKIVNFFLAKTDTKAIAASPAKKAAAPQKAAKEPDSLSSFTSEDEDKGEQIFTQTQRSDLWTFLGTKKSKMNPVAQTKNADVSYEL